MHRILTETRNLTSASPELSKDDALHLKVLRLKDNECVELFDGNGATRVFSYSRASRGLSPVSEINFLPRPTREITLFACITKLVHWEWMLEKATELGVGKIVPIISERTIVKIANDESKLERWRKIISEAARQSNSIWLPQLSSAISFENSLALVKETNCFVGALTTPPSKPLLTAWQESKDKTKPPAIFVGPEGDFTPRELSALLQIAKPTSFGKTILRAETAAIFSLSVLSAAISTENN